MKLEEEATCSAVTGYTTGNGASYISARLPLRHLLHLESNLSRF